MSAINYAVFKYSAGRSQETQIFATKTIWLTLFSATIYSYRV
jgi:hypothetical protein